MLRFACSVIFTITLLLLTDKQCYGNPSLDSDEIDICDFVNGQQIYCNCDNQGVDEARQVTCFIVTLDKLIPSASVWNGFRRQKRITSLLFTTRLETKLEYLPVNALRHVSESLEILTINEANLGTLSNYSMNNFTKLSKISFERNEINDLSISTFAHLPSLTSLGLSENKILRLRANVFVDIPKLDELILDRNHISVIDDYAFSHLRQLREIDLRLNQIEVITRFTFAGLNNLRRLDLSRNRLRVIPNYAFTGALRIRELDLNQNNLEIIEENAFHNTSHLMSLQLNNNQIKLLPSKVFKGSPQLFLIDLSGNNLETIERQSFDSLDHLLKEQFVVYIKDNEFVCDCRLLWLTNMSRVTRSAVFKRELRQIRCTVKDSFGNLQIGDHPKVIHGLGENDLIVKICEENELIKNVTTVIPIVNNYESTDISREPIHSTIGIVERNKNANTNNQSVDNNSLESSEGNEEDNEDDESKENVNKDMILFHNNNPVIITSTESDKNKYSGIGNEINDESPNVSGSRERNAKRNKNNKDNAVTSHLSFWLIISCIAILIYK